MSTAKVDSGASIGRAQLAERMRRMIFNATGVDSKGITSSELQINEQHSVETSADYEVAPATEVSISNDALPLSNETLPSSNETLPIYPKDQGDETTQVSNDSLPSNVSTGNVPLLGNDLYGNDSLPSNDSSGNVPLPSNDSSPNFSGNVPLPSNDSLPKNTQETGNGTLPDNGSLPKNTPETGNKTLPSNDSLPYWSDISPYGEPISEELFLLVLDAGMVELRASILGDSESVSMLFYWLITRQRRSILYLTYAKMVEDFNYTKPKLSRALDKFREHPLFSVKATHKGVFISIQRLLDRIKQTYPQFDHTDSNESLPPVSSSNNIYIYNQKKITTTTSNESLLPLCSLTDIDFHVLVDLITFYGFGPKEISLKVTETIATIYNVYGLEKIAFNLAYASGNK
jgi:hypothetical protein